MKTLNLIVAFMVSVVLSVVSFGCGDSDSPTAPSSTVPVPMASSDAFVPPSSGSATLQPASFDTVAPGDERYGPNAYDFYAHADSGMLHVALVEDEMSTMRRASQPHRIRQVEVYHVTSEPHHVGQVHGPPLYSGSVQLSGRIELPPIAMAEWCASHEWLVVTAAEMTDDRYNGWRNAPCPQQNGVATGSDGSGPGWDRGQHGPPERDFPPAPESEPMPEPEPAPAPEQEQDMRRGVTIRTVAADGDYLMPMGGPNDCLGFMLFPNRTHSVTTNRIWVSAHYRITNNCGHRVGIRIVHNGMNADREPNESWVRREWRDNDIFFYPEDPNTQTFEPDAPRGLTEFPAFWSVPFVPEGTQPIIYFCPYKLAEAQPQWCGEGPDDVRLTTLP